MPLYETTYNLKSNNRKNIRRELTELFISEEPGTEKKNALQNITTLLKHMMIHQ